MVIIHIEYYQKKLFNMQGTISAPWKGEQPRYKLTNFPPLKSRTNHEHISIEMSTTQSRNLAWLVDREKRNIPTTFD
jgi:hypothetical protein